MSGFALSVGRRNCILRWWGAMPPSRSRRKVFVQRRNCFAANGSGFGSDGGGPFFFVQIPFGQVAEYMRRWRIQLDLPVGRVVQPGAAMARRRCWPF